MLGKVSLLLWCETGPFTPSQRLPQIFQWPMAFSAVAVPTGRDKVLNCLSTSSHHWDKMVNSEISERMQDLSAIPTNAARLVPNLSLGGINCVAALLILNYTPFVRWVDHCPTPNPPPQKVVWWACRHRPLCAMLGAQKSECRTQTSVLARPFQRKLPRRSGPQGSFSFCVRQLLYTPRADEVNPCNTSDGTSNSPKRPL